MWFAVCVAELLAGMLWGCWQFPLVGKVCTRTQPAGSYSETQDIVQLHQQCHVFVQEDIDSNVEEKRVEVTRRPFAISDGMHHTK
jgi:hypothetical protein